jgi:hypothetical protein
MFLGSVKAAKYLKGTGPGSIQVATFAGICLQSGSDGTLRQTHIDGHPTGELPPSGTRVLLYLNKLSDQSFQPLLFGIEPLQPDSEDQLLRKVELLVEEDRRLNGRGDR